MKFEERIDGDYRIYAGALDVLRGDGYIAAVVVNRTRSPHAKGQEVFRDESLACGHRWSTADEALMFALCKAREWIGHQHQHAPKDGLHNSARSVLRQRQENFDHVSHEAS